MVGKSFKNILTDKIENHEAEDYFHAMDLSPGFVTANDRGYVHPLEYLEPE